MSVKINVGVNKKIGLPDYGSAGSHCEIELEMDYAAMLNPETFRERVQNAYRLCRESVESELAAHRPKDNRPTTMPKTEYSHSPPERNENRYPVSEKQLDFIGKLTKAIRGLSVQKLDDYCQKTFGKVTSQLSAKEGSQLIDALKDAKAGKGLV
jgi:hypothetical protein